MAAKWTEAQKKAIETGNKTILVSAAAGSGKTTTLTERIIRRLVDEELPADISRFLIVTFTKAAASDLKSKISKALGEALAKDPGSRHLSRQMIKLGSADICTMDSFYLGVVKSNFELLGLPARLNMMDEGELAAMKLNIMNEVIEDFYEERREAFRDFMDCFMDSRGSINVSESLISLYEKLSGYPDFLEFLTKNADKLEDEAKMPFLCTRAGREIALSCEKFFEHCERIYSDALELFAAEDRIEAAYSPAFAYEKAHFEKTKKAILAGDYTEAARLFAEYSPIPMKGIKNVDKIYAPYKDMRKKCKEKYEKMREELFCYSEKTLAFDALHTAEFCRTLYDVLTEFHRRFAEEKISRGACDFTDNKRFAFKLFIGDDGMPTPLAREYAAKYDEIYIDEYQDTDIVQDKIFEAISNADNRFMVGDIKQSIYRFRGAKPSVFAGYKNTFPDVSMASRSMSCAIYMSENFRCDKTVIDITNAVCGYIFRKGPNNIGYTDNDDLVFGKRIEPRGREMTNARLMVIRSYDARALDKMPDDERKKCEGKGSELEVRAVVSEICRLLNDPEEKCEDHGSLRRIRPSDIAILTRNNSSANLFAKALSDVGVPCSARTTVNYFENPEVLLVMSLLNVIDNPQKDVYLAGVLRSPLYGFGIGDLITIRKGAKESGSLYDDLLYAFENAESESLRNKIGFFLEKLRLYREQAKLLPVDKLLRFLYSDTLILSYAGGDEENEDAAAAERRANLLLLYDYARRYETGSYKGLYSFINYINDIISSGQTVEPPAATGSSNVVSVMTIHNSKGLEFPVCFIASIQKKLKNSSKNGVIEFDYDLGLGIRFGEESGFATFDNALRRAVIGKNWDEEMEEEMRVLYVAMTRARERLYMSGYVSSDGWEEAAENRAKYADEYSIMSCSGYFEWITTAYYAMNESDREKLNIEKLMPYDIPELSKISYEPEASISEGKEDEEGRDGLYEILKYRFSFEYEYSHLSRLPAKLSVSKLYPEVLDPMDAEEPFESGITLLDKPSFLIPKAERATGAERGTATHTFMQFCDFGNAENKGVSEEIARLCEMGFIARETAELINIKHVERFFESNFYRALKASLSDGGRLWREQRFNIGMPAANFTGDEEFREKIKDEMITVQGIIDLVLMDKDGNITLCDYKTDRLTFEELSDPALAAKKLGERHGRQLSYYCTAVEKIFGKAPARICIYSLPLGEAVDIRIVEN
ncbi:MAG: helicase-exonuclease AddAB subunit AddA [Clostridia bacterium]|nr:helicase-exonuclease AddAB subunit AddA [Clostridia bacterium]